MTLPVVPKALGNLRHVFSSSLLAVQKKPNPLGLKPKKKIVCILVDGMGAENILARAGHAPYLAAAVRAGAVGFSGFPSTTSANIASFATGLSPGEHGLIGHAVYDRKHDRTLNLLTGWDESTDPLLWQPNTCVSELSTAAGIACNVIGHAEYQHSGYTMATMRTANYLVAESMRERFDRAIEVMVSKSESISYLYIPELDKYGHKFGWETAGWAALLEEVDGELRRLVGKLPSDAGVLVVADHGMMDSPLERRLYIDDFVDQGGLVDHFAGDTRASYLYLKQPGLAESFAVQLNNQQEIFTAVSGAQAQAANWFGPIGPEARDRFPDVILLAKSNITLFHSVFTKKRAFDMTAHHGGLTSQETRVPLVRIGF